MNFRKFWKRFQSTRIKCSVKQCLNYNDDKQNCWFEKKGYSGKKHPNIVPYIRSDGYILNALAICDCFRYNEHFEKENQ